MILWGTSRHQVSETPTNNAINVIYPPVMTNIAAIAIENCHLQLIYPRFHSYVILLGGLEPWNFMTFHSVGNVIIPTDELIFFRGVGIPPTSIYLYISIYVHIYVNT